MKLRIFKLIGLSILLLNTGIAYSDVKTAVVFLESIDVQTISEKKNDEIYLNVTEYSNLGTSNEYRIPEKPLHWLSKDLSHIKSLKIWQGDIKENEEIKIILSVVEEDLRPWDMDDLIGSAEITLTNSKGMLEKHWSVPVFEDNVETDLNSSQNSGKLKEKTSKHMFLMKGDHSHYRVTFSVLEQ